MDDYEPTTERLDVDDCSGSLSSHLNYLFHMASYAFAANRLGLGSRVLDYGCGTGYGTYDLAESGLTAVGVDVSEASVDYARKRYESPRLEYRTVTPIEEGPLPFEDGSFDAVVSFQVIEHVPSADAYLIEVARLLRPGGTFICVTPDRATRLFPRQRPWVRWHVDEFSPEQLAQIVQRLLQVDEVMGMTAPADAMATHQWRNRLLKVVTFPFTFPGAPERWRVAGLDGLRRASGGVGSLRRRRRRSADASQHTDTLHARSLGIDDIVIAAGVTPSSNIVLTATKAH